MLFGEFRRRHRGFRPVFLVQNPNSKWTIGHIMHTFLYIIRIPLAIAVYGARVVDGLCIQSAMWTREVYYVMHFHQFFGLYGIHGWVCLSEME